MTSRWRVLAGIAPALAALSVTLFPQTRPAPARPAAPSAVTTLRIIVLDTEDEARRVREELLRGANFVALAARISRDPSAASGGLLGPIAAADLQPQIRTVLETLAPGELSAVVRLPRGFGIIKLVPNSDASALSSEGQSGGPTVMGSVAGSGVRYVYDVSGYVETVLALRNVTMTAEDSQDLARLCSLRRQLVTSAQKIVQDTLAAPGAAAMAPIDRAQANVLQGQLLAFHGDMAPAIAAFERARSIADAQVPALRLQLDEALGVAHLHKAEQDNGVYERPGVLDLLPPAPGARFTRNTDLTAAIRHFTRYLAEAPDEYEVRWLLNIAHMYAGTWPDGVPAA